MEKELIDTMKKAVNNWWLSLLVGIICVAFGIWCFATPLETFLTLTVLFVAGFLVTGLFEIIFAISNRANIHGWGWNLTMGIIDVLFSVVLLANPLLAPSIFAYFIIFWLMFQSFWGIGASIDLSKYKGSGWEWLLAIAIIGLILSMLLLCQPIISGILASYFFASIFIVYGIFRIILGVRLKSLHKYL